MYDGFKRIYQAVDVLKISIFAILSEDVALDELVVWHELGPLIPEKLNSFLAFNLEITNIFILVPVAATSITYICSICKGTD